MSDADETDELEEIRRRKRERLEARLQGEDVAPESASGAASESASGAAPDEPIHVEGSAHLDDLTDRYDAVLIDFYADWCGPCKMLEPVVADAARETDAAVAKVDIDAQQRLATEYGVQSVPTLVLFADGSPVERLLGVQQKETLLHVIRQYS